MKIQTIEELAVSAQDNIGGAWIMANLGEREGVLASLGRALLALENMVARINEQAETNGFFNLPKINRQTYMNVCSIARRVNEWPKSKQKTAARSKIERIVVALGNL